MVRVAKYYSRMSSKLVTALLRPNVASLTLKYPQKPKGLPGIRQVSTNTLVPQAYQDVATHQKLPMQVQDSERTFQRLSFKALIRGIILGQIFKSPYLFKPSLSLLEKIANSRSKILNADHNPLIRAFVLPLVYRQFCAGRDVAEIKSTIAEIKAMGYSGVILCYGGEVLARKDAQGVHSQIEQASDNDLTFREVEAWKNGHLATLDAVGEGDYIGIKYTGAGPTVSQALKDGRPPPSQMLQAMFTICDRAQAQNTPIWIDAEQQVFHPGIDDWTIDLMRKYNNNGQALILTTIQSYLKSSRQNITRYLRLAQQESWTLGIKLVRGAYIASDIRANIHDTKPETDASYDGIAHDLITKKWPDLASDFPHVHLFLAGHNATSIRKATTQVKDLAEQDQITEPQAYGQLLGMADDIGCGLLSLADQIKQANAEVGSPDQIRRSYMAAPRAYKCLTWGSVHDCLHYLVRRAVENQGAAERLNVGLAEMKKELRMRMLGF